MLSAAESAAIGRLIKTRDWKRVAREVGLTALEGQRTDLVPALEYVSGLLPFILRLRLRRSTFANEPSWRANDCHDDQWLAVAQLAAELYPSGPSERRVWERAGGDLGSLDLRGSGRDIWQNAIRYLRQGGKLKAGSVDVLLKTMLEDYQRNSDLQTLAGMEW